MYDLFAGGSGTTNMGLYWTIFYMAKFPHIQAKVQAELSTHYGPHTLPTCTGSKDSQLQLPYTWAVMSESLRKTSLAFQSPPHVATEEVVVDGFTIPKGCILLQNLYQVHHDEEFWERPQEFYPQHFLDEAGK